MSKKVSELLKAVEFEIYSYFDKKIEKADLPDDIRDKLYERIELCIDKASEEIEDTNFDIDYEIEELETQRNMLPPYPDGWALRQNELYEASKYM